MGLYSKQIKPRLADQEDSEEMTFHVWSEGWQTSEKNDSDFREQRQGCFISQKEVGWFWVINVGSDWMDLVTGSE